MNDQLPITTTLNAIREHNPCQDGWEKLLKHLGKTKPDDEPLKFSTILESNGVEDAYWCLCALPEDHDNRVRLLLAEVAEGVLHLFEREFPNDDRPRKAIEAARAYARGEISAKELIAAWAAAWDAAWAAAGAAARAAAGAAAWAAAGAAARAAAWDAQAAAGAAERNRQGDLLVKYF